MTSPQAPEGFDTPLTPEMLAQAVVRGRKRMDQGVHATAVRYVPALKSLLVGFIDHSAVVLPVKNYPELADLARADLEAFTVGFGGSALCLDARDLHISIAGLVSASQPLMDMAASLVAARNGRKSSPAKLEAARANGRKGGRPKLAVAG